MSRLEGLRVPDMLPAREMRRLEQEMAQNEAARNKIVAGNMPFVIHQAQKYARSGTSLKDLVQAGAEGMVIASHRYDPGRGVTFLTFAVHYIHRWIQSAITENVAVRQPQNRRKESQELHEHHHALTQTVLRDVSYNDAELDLWGRRRNLHHHMLHPDDEPVPGAWDFLATTAPDNDAEAHQQTAIVQKGLELLRPRDREIVRRYYWEGETLREIGEALGLTKERVRQRRDFALARLKKYCRPLE